MSLWNDEDRVRTLVGLKQYVLRQERQYERVSREVEAFTKHEKLDKTSREPIADHVGLFRLARRLRPMCQMRSDGGLEFGRIIPFSAGGSSTERNIQLL